MSAISVKNLTKTFKSFTAVDDLSFDVAENHVVGFLGPNGAGKTTSLRMLVGLSEPDSGTITICGVPVRFGSSDANHLIGYLPELPSMYAWMSGQEYMEFIADIFKMPAKKKFAKIAELLKLVDLVEAKDKRIGAYSGGMKQRLGIAQALLNDPKVIILDEPVSALDPIGRKEVLRIIEKLKKTRTVLFSTHVLSDVDKICDDIVLLNHGKLVIAKPLAALKAEYAAPLLEVEFTASPASIVEDVEKQPWAKRVEQNGDTMKIWLFNSDAVEANVPLEYFATQHLGVLSYGLRLPETEDLFVELLGGHNE